MRRVTNRDWTEKTIWQPRPLTLAANLEIYVLVG
jgi:hypothetical protein